MDLYPGAGRLRAPRRPTPIIPSDALARLLAAGATVAVLLGALHALLGSGPRAPRPPASAIELMFIAPLPHPIPSPAPPIRTPLAVAPVSVPSHIAETPDNAAPTPREGPADDVARPRLHYGALLGDGDPIAFVERLPGQRDTYRTPFEARPERFRMRRQITPEDVVRGFAQLVGLWPPGYTDSPCPAIRRLIETTPERPSPSELALLQDAVLARERFCR